MAYLKRYWKIFTGATLLLLLGFGIVLAGGVDFDVISASPQHPLLSPADEIVIRFSKALIGLHSVGSMENLPLEKFLKIEPPLKGRLQYKAQDTLRFKIDKSSLQPNTRYRVSVKQGIKALDGSPLMSPHSFHFDNQRLTLAGCSWRKNQQDLSTRPRLFLVFNLPVDTSSGGVLLENSRTGKRHPLKLVRYKKRAPYIRNRFISWREYRKLRSGSGKQHVYQIQTPELERNTGYTLTVNADSLRAAKGRLPLIQDREIPFHTIRPLTVSFHYNRILRPDGNIRLQFRHGLAIDKKTLLQKIKVFDADDKEVTIRQSSYYKGSGYCYLWPDFKPGQRYRVSVLPGVKDKYGQRLAELTSREVEVGDYAPTLDIPFPRNTMVESYGKIHHLPMRFVNLLSLRASVNVYHTPKDYIYDTPSRSGERNFQEDIATKNKQFVFRLPLKQYLRNKRGIARIRLNYETRENNTGKKEYLLQFSGLSMTVKYSPENIFIHVTRLRDGRSAGVTAIEIWDKKERERLFAGSTDSKGNLTARLDGTALAKRYRRYDYRSQLVFFARKGDDFCKLDGTSGNRLSLYNSGVSYHNTGNRVNKYITHLFTPKGIYKKKETVLIKGYVRENRGGKLTVPAYRNFKLTVRDSAGTTVLKKEIKLNLWGSFQASYALPDDPGLGRYRMRLESQEQKKSHRYNISFGHGSFLVEAFRPREFEATVGAGVKGQRYFPKSAIPVRIRGQYFYGGLMAGGRLKYRVTATPFHFNPAGSRYKGFHFSSNQWLEGGKKAAWKSVKKSKKILHKTGLRLDGRGEARFRLKGESPFFCSARLTVAAEVTDEKRQSIAESDSAVVHQGRYYIGVKLSDSFLSTKETLKVKLLALRPDSRPAGRRPMTARLYRVEWKNVRKLSSDGTWRWKTEVRHIPVRRFRTWTTPRLGGGAQLNYRPEKAGRYVLTLESRDRAGNRITNTAQFWVWGGYASWKMSDDQIIDLVKDQESYKPGETAKIMVKSPYKKVRALVTVEREGVINSFVTVLHGSADIVRIPIKPAYQPNVFVSVVLLQGRIDNKFPLSKLKDIYRPTVKIGYAVIPVSSEHKKLRIKIDKNKKEYKPGERVRLRVQVKDQRGRPRRSEVALFVVDEGVLSLIGYKTPNPFALFHSQRELLVRTYDNRLSILGQHAYKLKGETPGGGGSAMSPRNGSDGLSSVNARKVFKSIAFQKADIITDGRGRASLSFTLPDNLTRFRIMAVAVDRSDRFGSAQAPLRVSKKLIIRPALPRFVNLGDTMTAGLVVDNNSSVDGRVRVSARVSGGVQIKGRRTASLRIPARQSREIRFKMDARKAGDAKFDFTAVITRRDGKRFTDRVEWRIPVQIPRIRLTVAKSSHLDGARHNESLQLPQNIWPGSGRIRLSAASTALVHLDGAVRYLYNYPYGCLEQRISRILPMVLAEKMVRAFKLPIKEDYRKWTQDLLNKLSVYQDKANGGFYHWPEKRYRHRPSPYLSVQTFYLLHLARSKGYTIDPLVYARALRYVKKVAGLSASFKRHYPYHAGYWAAVDIAAFSLLAETGNADRSYAHTLYRASLRQPIYVKAVLAKALYRVDKREYGSLYRRLLRDIRRAIKYEGRYAWVNEDGGNWSWYRQLYLSDGKATATVLDALIRITPKDPLIPKLVAGLMRSRKRGRWRTTQENQFVFRALNTYFEKYEKVSPFFVADFKVGARSLFKAAFRGRSLSMVSKEIGFASLPGRGSNRMLSLSKRGRGRLYYSLSMRYLPKKLPGQIDRGFAVERKVYAQNGKRQIKDGRYTAGEVYTVELIVKTGAGRYDVVVDDPLPAGFEAINPNLKSVSIDGGRTTQRSDRWWHGFNRVAMKDDRVCLFATYLPEGTYRFRYFIKATVKGRFFKAPVKAEEMYYPEIFGTGKTRRIQIR